jgi:uncharacterized protein (TIGR00369 family)
LKEFKAKPLSLEALDQIACSLFYLTCAKMTSHFKPPDHPSYPSPEDRVQAVLDDLWADQKNKGFDTEGLQNIKCVAASVEKQMVEFEMTTTPILCNKNQVLHGGAAAMLLDMLASAILGMLVKLEYLDNSHFSWTLTITYLRPLPVEAKVKIGCRAVALSKRMADLYGAIKTTEGKACVICVHDLVVLEGRKL